MTGVYKPDGCWGCSMGRKKSKEERTDEADTLREETMVSV